MKSSKIVYVGICARRSGKRSGKDEFAYFCMKHFFDNNKVYTTRIALADSLKEAAQRIYNLTDKQLCGTQEDRESLTEWFWPTKNKLNRTGKMTAREILQYFGTEIMREGFDQLIWVNSLKSTANARARAFQQGVTFVFVPDIRYPNEAEHMDYLVDIYRTEAELANGDMHISERSGMLIPDYKIDFSVVNDGTLQELEEKAALFCESILLKGLESPSNMPVEAIAGGNNEKS